MKHLNPEFLRTYKPMYCCDCVAFVQPNKGYNEITYDGRKINIAKLNKFRFYANSIQEAYCKIDPEELESIRIYNVDSFPPLDIIKIKGLVSQLDKLINDYFD